MFPFSLITSCMYIEPQVAFVSRLSLLAFLCCCVPWTQPFFFFFTNKLVSYFACFGVPSIGSFCPTNTDNRSAAMSTYVNMIKARLAKTVSKIVSYVYAKRILVQALAERHFI